MPAIENRVRFDDYGGRVLERGDPRLVPVTSAGKQQYLHWAAAEAFEALRADALVAGFGLKIGSGWRPPRFSTRNEWRAFLIKRYGSVAAGSKWLGFRTGHNLGLSLDIVGEGLEISSATAAAQKQLPVYRWLVDNAYKYGLTPYLTEAWHWEAKIPMDTFLQGAASSGVWSKIAAGAAVVGAVALFVYRRSRPRIVIIEE